MTPEQIAAMAEQHAQQEDYTKEAEHGDFDRDLPKAGICVFRFREYIELGLHPTKSDRYPNKKPANIARFVFELCTPHHQYEYKTDEGTADEVTHKRGHVISVQCPISNSPKSNYMKLFRALNWQGKAKVPAQCLGNPYKGHVYYTFDAKDIGENNQPKPDAKPKYANLGESNGGSVVYSVAPPRAEADPLTPEIIKEINVPAIIGELKCFVWSLVTKEAWDSLFIDGTRNATIEGKEVEVSKNWIQEKITAALNYEGSPLQVLLLGLAAGTTLDDLPTAETPVTDGVDPLAAKKPVEEQPPVAEPTGLEGLMGADVPV